MKSDVTSDITNGAGRSHGLPKSSAPIEPVNSSLHCLSTTPAASGTNSKRGGPSEQDPILEPAYSDDECDADLEELEEMLLHSERDQARERGDDPFDNLPEVEYIIANEWDA